jgi:hypothetical protein
MTRRLCLAMLVGALLAVAQPAGAAPSTPPGSDPAERRFDPATFAAPVSSDRPNAFWFWNGQLTEPELERQLVEMRAGGVDEFFIHPRQGLGGVFGKTENAYYLSRDYFEKVGFVLDRARALGMHAWLYDDLNWPSGYAGGRVLEGGEVDGRQVAGDPDLIARYLQIRPRDVSGPGVYEEDVPSGPEGTDPELVAVLAAPVEDGSCAQSGRPAGGRLDGGGVVDVTGDVRDGRLRWDVPEGDWCVLWLQQQRLVNYHPDLEPENRYVDMLNPVATRRFIEFTHETYARRFGNDMGGLIRGIFNDEPGFYNNFPDGRGGADSRGSVPWTPGFREYLEQRAGRDAIERLPALWYDTGDGTAAARVDYYDALQDRYTQAHTRPLADWAAEHGIALISNPLVEESLGDHKLIEGGDWFEMSREYQIPGMDLISGLNLDAVTPKLNSSVAHAFDRGRNLAESFGAFGWDLTLEEMKRGIAWEASAGVDLTDNHAFYYSIEGQRAFESQPSEFFQNVFWPHFRRYADTVGRLNGPARGSTPVNPIGVLYPTTTILAEGTPGDNRGFAGNGPALGPVNASWQGVSTALLRGQLDFDYVNERQLAGDPDLGAPVRADGGELAVHESRYRTLLWPRTTTLQLEALDEVERFVRGGGSLVAVEGLPTQEAEGRDARLRERLQRLFGTDPAAPVASSRGFGEGHAVFLPSHDGLAATVRGLARPDVVLAPAAGDVRVRHVRRGGEHAFLLTNTADRLVRTDADLDRPGVPELWYPETGTTGRAPVYRSRPGGRTVVPLALEPYESVWVIFRDQDAGAAHATASNARIESVRRSGDALAVRAIAARPGSHYAAGVADGRSYAAEFEVTDPLEPIALDGDWDFRFEREGAETVTRPLASWTDLDPRYSGRGRYTRRFSVPAGFVAAGRRIQLELGQVDEIAEVRLNGRDVGDRVWAPYRLDVTSDLRAGENTLEVVVTNTQANEIESRPLSSGLLGPVALRPERVVDVALQRGAQVEGLDASVAPASSTVVSGSAQALTVTLEGYAEGTLAGTLRAEPPAGWTADPAAQPFSLRSDGVPVAQEYGITIAVPADAAEGFYAIPLSAETARGRRATATATIRVAEPIQGWEFETDGDAEGWQATNQVEPFTVAGGALQTRSTGGDPFIVHPGLALDATAPLVVEITMATSTGGGGQVFWATPSGGFAEARSTRFAVEAGRTQVYRVPVPAQGGPITALRLDPLTAPGDIRIEAIRVFR